MPAIVVTIDSDTVCVHAQNGNIAGSITESINGPSTAQITIQDIDHADWAAKLPGGWLFKEITIEHGSELLFGGVITRQQNSGLPGLSQHAVITLNASDFSWWLGARIIFKSWEAGETVSQIVADCLAYDGPVADNLLGQGFTSANTSITPTIPRRYIADGKRMSEVFSDIAALTGYHWWVDQLKDVHFQLNGDTAPYDLDEAVGVANYEAARTERTTENYRNTQWIKQPLAALAPLIEVWEGTGTDAVFFMFSPLADAPRVVVRTAKYAEELITFTGNPVDGDELELDGTTYTFVDVLSAAFDVQIGANRYETTRNLTYAINGTSSWAGVYFHESTTLHPTCEAAYLGGFTITARVREIGTGNGTTLSTTSANITVGAATLTGALAGTVDEKTVGVYGVDAPGSADWYWAPGSTAINQDGAGPILVAGEFLEVSYHALFSNSIYASDEAEVTTNFRVEAIEEADESSTGADMYSAARSRLRKYGKADATMVGYVQNSNKQPLLNQLRVGMAQGVTFPNTHGFTGSLLVTDIARRFYGEGSTGSLEWQMRCEVSGIAYPGAADNEPWDRWSDLFLPDGRGGGSAGPTAVASAAVSTVQLAVFKIVPTASGTDILREPARLVCPGQKVILSFAIATVKLAHAPATDDVIIDLLRSDDEQATFDSLFPSGDANKIVLPVGDSTVTETPSPWAVPILFDGDIVRADVIQGDAATLGMEIVLFGQRRAL